MFNSACCNHRQQYKPLTTNERHYMEMNFWKTRTFKTIEAMNAWLAKNDRLVEWNEIYINNAYGVEYRQLRKVY